MGKQMALRYEILKGLKDGRTLIVQLKDAPELPICQQLLEEGLVTQELVQLDEQSSVLKFRWKES